jgi:hypothetical protein
LNVSNPSIEEIKAWAYSNKEWPHDEWDLFLAWKQEVGLFIELATDAQCPKKEFFHHILYYLVGYTYSQPRELDPHGRIGEYISAGRLIQDERIRLWVEQSERLLKGKLPYDYSEWRGGKLAGYRLT